MRRLLILRAVALVLSIAVHCGSVGAAAPTPVNPETLPMFGQPKIARSDSQKQADEAFIRDNALRYKTRQAASSAFVSQGLMEAIEHLETARELIDDPVQRPALLADLGNVHSEYASRLSTDKQLERAHHFVMANSRFTECVENDPKFASGWREWAISLYDQERYSEAWIKAKRARELKAEPFPPEFLKKLSAKMPEPK
jgi:hypothetical protein